MANRRCENVFSHSCLTKQDCYEETRFWKGSKHSDSRCLCRACFKHNEMKHTGTRNWWNNAIACTYPPIDERDVRDVMKLQT